MKVLKKKKFFSFVSRKKKLIAQLMKHFFQVEQKDLQNIINKTIFLQWFRGKIPIKFLLTCDSRDIHPKQNSCDEGSRFLYPKIARGQPFIFFSIDAYYTDTLSNNSKNTSKFIFSFPKCHHLISLKIEKKNYDSLRKLKKTWN